MKSLFLSYLLSIFLLNAGQSVHAISLAEQFKQTGYLEIGNNKQGAAEFDSFYLRYDKLIEFFQKNPAWVEKLYSAKERFIRSKNKNWYGTNFFGFYNELERRGQVSFYYSTRFHQFIYSHYPEFKRVPEIICFFETCREIQEQYDHLFDDFAAELGLESMPVSQDGNFSIILKVIKYFPTYIVTSPHYDGSALSLFLDSTDNESLLLSPYKSLFTINDFSAPRRKFSRSCNQNSMLLIPGTLLKEFAIFPTPHIVVQSGKIRHATIAFALRPNYNPQKNEFSILPNFKH